MPVEAVEPGGGVFERGVCADQVIDADFAAGHQVDTLGVFAGRGTGALQPDLPGDHLLQRQVDLGAEVADQGNGATLADSGDRGLDRRGHSHGFEHCVGAASAGAGAYFGGRVAGSGVQDRVGAGGARATASLASSTSTPITVAKPAAFAAWMVSWPIMPQPTTTAVSSGAIGVRLTA